MTKEATIVGALVAFAAAADAAVLGESARASFPGEPGRIAFMVRVNAILLPSADQLGN